MDLHKINCVVVDDDPLMLKIIASGLNALGVAQVQTFEVAEEALAFIGSNRDLVNVVLCDIFMPDTDGMEFLRALTASGYAGSVGIVSGAGDLMLNITQRLGNAQGLNVLGAVAKPVTVETLRALLSPPDDGCRAMG
ncbi:MAG: response regulator [Rhodospirillales bacterium]